MPELVVILLELVQVEHEKRELALAAHLPADFDREAFEKIAAQIKAGQAVLDGQLFQAFVQLRVLDGDRPHVGNGGQKPQIFGRKILLMRAVYPQDPQSLLARPSEERSSKSG